MNEPITTNQPAGADAATCGGQIPPLPPRDLKLLGEMVAGCVKIEFEGGQKIVRSPDTQKWIGMTRLDVLHKRKDIIRFYFVSEARIEKFADGKWIGVTAEGVTTKMRHDDFTGAFAELKKMSAGSEDLIELK